MRKSWLLLVACAAAAILAAARPTAASAFLQPPGEGQLITTLRFSRADAGFGASGRLKSGAFYSKAEIQAYAEYGIAEWATLVFAPSVMHLHVKAAPPPGYTGLGDSELAARVRVLAYGPAIVSLQAGVLTRGDVAGFGHRGLPGKAALQGDIRLLAGLGFACGPFACFADAQAGYRSHVAQAGSEIRADLTLGLRPVPDVLLLAQSFSSLSRGAVRTESHKLQLSAIYDFSKHWSFQLGLFATVLGRNAPRERGVLSAVWLRF